MALLSTAHLIKSGDVPQHPIKMKLLPKIPLFDACDEQMKRKGKEITFLKGMLSLIKSGLNPFG